MDHDEAMRLQAVERYIAHQLSPDEERKFEEHFFDCRQCAEDVNFETTFAANVRAAIQEPVPERRAIAEPRPAGWAERWRLWLRPSSALAFSLAANFALLVGVAYMELANRPEAAPATITSDFFAPGPTHGAADEIHDLPAGSSYYIVRFLTASRAVSSYSYEVLDSSGRRQSSGILPAPSGQDDSLCLQLPVRRLRPGLFTLVVRARSGGEIVSWSKFRTSR